MSDPERTAGLPKSDHNQAKRRIQTSLNDFLLPSGATIDECLLIPIHGSGVRVRECAAPGLRRGLGRRPSKLMAECALDCQESALAKAYCCAGGLERLVRSMPMTLISSTPGKRSEMISQCSASAVTSASKSTKPLLSGSCQRACLPR